MPYDDTGYAARLYTGVRGTTRDGKHLLDIVAMDRFGNTAIVHQAAVSASSANAAHHMAAVKGLDLCHDHGFRTVAHLVSHPLVAKQLGGELNVNDHALRPMHHSYKELKGKFDRVIVMHDPGEKSGVDMLASFMQNKRDEHDAAVID